MPPASPSKKPASRRCRTHRGPAPSHVGWPEPPASENQRPHDGEIERAGDERPLDQPAADALDILQSLPDSGLPKRVVHQQTRADYSEDRQGHDRPSGLADVGKARHRGHQWDYQVVSQTMNPGMGFSEGREVPSGSCSRGRFCRRMIGAGGVADRDAARTQHPAIEHGSRHPLDLVGRNRKRPAKHLMLGIAVFLPGDAERPVPLVRFTQPGGYQDLIGFLTVRFIGSSNDSSPRGGSILRILSQAMFHWYRAPFGTKVLAPLPGIRLATVDGDRVKLRSGRRSTGSQPRLQSAAALTARRQLRRSVPVGNAQTNDGCRQQERQQREPRAESMWVADRFRPDAFQRPHHRTVHDNRFSRRVSIPGGLCTALFLEHGLTRLRPAPEDAGGPQARFGPGQRITGKCSSQGPESGGL